MSPTESNYSIYNPISISAYCRTLPLWRRILARFFEKYKVSKEEFDDWFFRDLSKN